MTDAPSFDFERHRGRLIGLAYRMLGSVAEAEDIVQDAYLRWHNADRRKVANAGAFLSKVVTRLCLDVLKSSRHNRETYVGAWLPEPLVADGMAADPENNAAKDISFALMLALERLSPLERAAFILHDMFDMEFDEIAAALGRNETACRQLARRARANVREARPRFKVEPSESDEVAKAFFSASRSGDAAALRDLLAETAVLRSDGGGRIKTALNPIMSADRIARLFAGLARKRKFAPPLWSKRVTINGLPGLLTVEPTGLLQTIALEIAGGRVSAVYVTRNPDKLGHLAPMVPPELRKV
jgi:RNA polymerase sigma-70 factor, ECF subfamily